MAVLDKHGGKGVYIGVALGETLSATVSDLATGILASDFSVLLLCVAPGP